MIGPVAHGKEKARNENKQRFSKEKMIGELWPRKALEAEQRTGEGWKGMALRKTGLQTQPQLGVLLALWKEHGAEHVWVCEPPPTTPLIGKPDDHQE